MTKKKHVEKNEITAPKQDLMEEVKRRREDGAVFKVIKHDNGEIANADALPELDIQFLRTFGTVDRQCGKALLDQLASAHPGNLKDQEKLVSTAMEAKSNTLLKQPMNMAGGFPSPQMPEQMSLLQKC